MPFIPFQTRPDHYYVYDMNRNSIFKIKQPQFEALENINEGQENPDDINILKQFQTQGLLLETQVNKVEHPASSFLKNQLDRCVNSVTFQMTQNCNLRCGYCPYSDCGIYSNRKHNSKKITQSTLQKGIDFLIEHSSDVDHLHVAFYGGEPLLAKELIIETIEYTNSRVVGKTISYGMTTNGTLLDDSFVKRIRDYKISIMISLDGPEQVHNINRTFANGKGSYETIYKNINHIKDTYPDVYKDIKFNTVISPDSDYQQIFQFFRDGELADLTQASFNTLSTNYTDKNFNYGTGYFEERNFELLKTYLLLLGKLDKEPIATHKRDIELIYSMKEFLTPMKETPSVCHPGGTCVPGLKKLFIDVDGNFFPCERIDENSEFMKMGDVSAGFNIERVHEILNVGAVTQEECKNCWAFHHCSICPAAADTGKKIGYDKEYKLRKCDNVRANALDKLKNYTMMKEFKFSFDKEAIL